MRITICGSMQFAREMLEMQADLERLRHEAIVPVDTHVCSQNPHLRLNESIDHCEAFGDIDKDHYDKIAASEAILVLNYEKDGIAGYVGGASLMEIGVARHLDKKIFLLYEPPPVEILRYALEIRLARPIILAGDIRSIDNY